jgi:cytochrome c oxidase subunit IV
MADESVKQAENPAEASNQNMASKLSAAGWGLFFVWIGLAFLVSMDAGLVLLGIGAITLAIQMGRKSFGLPLELFWIVVGIVFLLAGILYLLDVSVPGSSGALLPILLVLAGLALLVSVFRGRRT